MEAGPPTSSTHESQSAPERALPATVFYSVEYPGYVKTSSAPLAVSNLGGQLSLDRAFKRNTTKSEALVELNLRRGNPFAHPVPGDVVGTNNILLKVTKRRRKKGPDGQDGAGEFVAEAVGVISKTVRFRSMADYQYMPDMSDPIAKLRMAMDEMDVQAIKKYVIPPEKENYTVSVETSDPPVDPQLMEGHDPGPSVEKERSNLRLFPPPIFTRQGIPQLYNYKANNMSVVTTVADPETGAEKKRLINKGRWKGYGPPTISFTDQGVPVKPLPNVQEVSNQADKRILALLVQRFEERPVWTREALYNQFTPADLREIQNSKILLPLVSYVFQDGPWRDTLVKFGYDPREDPNARLYQRLYFRNLNHPIVRPSVITRRQEGRHAATVLARNNEEQLVQERVRDSERPQSHVFDGVTLIKEVAAFQLCDIHDAMLVEMIEDEDGLRDVCNERDGWYTTHAFERIKTVLRYKFFSLLEGHIATDEACLALLEPKSGSDNLPRGPPRRRPGKHNMAKGAMAPEDIAAARLRTTLENNARITSMRSRRPD